MLVAVGTQEYVSSIIAVLGLTKAQHTIIGNAKVRGVSGGERKRVNIGVELIADPVRASRHREGGSERDDIETDGHW